MSRSISLSDVAALKSSLPIVTQASLDKALIDGYAPRLHDDTPPQNHKSTHPVLKSHHPHTVQNLPTKPPPLTHRPAAADLSEKWPLCNGYVYRTYETPLISLIQNILPESIKRNIRRLENPSRIESYVWYNWNGSMYEKDEYYSAVLPERSVRCLLVFTVRDGVKISALVTPHDQSVFYIPMYVDRADCEGGSLYECVLDMDNKTLLILDVYRYRGETQLNVDIAIRNVICIFTAAQITQINQSKTKHRIPFDVRGADWQRLNLFTAHKLLIWGGKQRETYFTRM